MLLNEALQSRAGKTLFGFNQTNCTERFGRPVSQLPPGCSVVREVSVPNTGLGLTRRRRYSDALSGKRSGRQPAFRHRGRCSPRGPVVAGFRRLSVGNAHVSCRWKGRFRWSRACRRWTVNPSRKLRRFESFTCHRVRERTSDLRRRGRRPSFLYLVGVSKTAPSWRSSGSGVADL